MNRIIKYIQQCEQDIAYINGLYESVIVKNSTQIKEVTRIKEFAIQTAEKTTVFLDSILEQGRAGAFASNR